MKCQVIIAGVGGQGVLFAAKILTEMARRRDLPVFGSQTFGMAQRGGSVMSHVKIGEFDSPLVREGDADLLLGLDAIEAHRTLSYLCAAEHSKGAMCVVNAPDTEAFPDRRIAEPLKEMGVAIHCCNADAAALELGSPLVANLVLLGFAAGQSHFPFSYEEMHDATAALSGSSHRKANLEALACGHARCSKLREPAPA